MTTWQVLRWNFSVGDLLLLTALRFAGVIMAACRACGSVVCKTHTRCITRYMYPRWRKDWIGLWGSLGAVFFIAEEARKQTEKRLGHELDDGELTRIRHQAGAFLLHQMQNAA